MPELKLHHVSIVTADLERSIAFYEEILNLTRLARPPFTTAGAWFACGSLQVHLILHPAGTFRTVRAIDTADAHFALHTLDFEAAVSRLKEHGFSEDNRDGDPMRLLVIRNGLAGFDQAYVLDPDNNIVEINNAP